MANHYFEFKRFTVYQEDAAMKVCTDSCLFGAILATAKLQTGRILDIGTGTGLLSLMYIQQHPEAQMDAIELDSATYRQARKNFEISPWPHAFRALNRDIRDFQPDVDRDPGYELIFSNPPFFEQDLKTMDSAKNRAWHSTDLNFRELVGKVVELLMGDGVFAVMIPFLRRKDMHTVALSRGLFLCRESLFKQTSNHMPFRAVQFYKFTETPEIDFEEIVIREDNHQYSLKFTQLLHPYYLYL